jgi:hypothetical protein
MIDIIEIIKSFKVIKKKYYLIEKIFFSKTLKKMISKVLIACIALSIIGMTVGLQSGEQPKQGGGRPIGSRNRPDLSETYGCFRGSCWTKCSFLGMSNEWCWATRGAQLTNQWVKCFDKYDCNPRFNCGTLCTV